ncbi:MAG: hypothetical protein RIS35_1136, partial [Pseudomonadota bacterium]
MERKIAAGLFWALLTGFIALDLSKAGPRDRFAEPPVLALGSERVSGAGHCS